MSKSLIIFDFFGVICSEVAPFWLSDYFSEEEAIRIKSDIVSLADSGNISQKELFKRLGKLAGIPPNKVEDEWWEYVSIDSKIVGLIDELKKSNYTIALLTNAPAPFFRDIIAKYNLENIFDAIIVSSEIGVAKPNKNIYVKLLSETKTDPIDAIFIDDNPSNINGAEAIGIDGILFESLEDLEKKLVDYE